MATATQSATTERVNIAPTLVASCPAGKVTPPPRVSSPLVVVGRSVGS